VGWVDSAAFEGHDPGPDHPESNARLEAIRNQFRLRDLDVALERDEPEPIERWLLERVHSSSYVKRVEQACAAGQRTRLDADTTVSAGSFQAALLAAGAGPRAIQKIVEGRWNRAFCSVRPPGHHAQAAQSGGFCIFNNVALTCEAALGHPSIERAAILDFDAHRGDGTESLFDDRDDVLCVSWHQRLNYPGPAAVPGTAIDCPLPLRATLASFLGEWRTRVLPALHGFAPDVVLVSAGFDADRRDPYALLAMNPEGFYDLTSEIVAFANEHCHGRIVSLLEGGYHLDALAEGAVAHVEALLELPFYR
jgi:acetoin utilization deacetylase AcuC-like enzyme